MSKNLYNSFLGDTYINFSDPLYNNGLVINSTNGAIIKRQLEKIKHLYNVPHIYNVKIECPPSDVKLNVNLNELDLEKCIFFKLTGNTDNVDTLDLSRHQFKNLQKLYINGNIDKLLLTNFNPDILLNTRIFHIEGDIKYLDISSLDPTHLLDYYQFVGYIDNTHTRRFGTIKCKPGFKEMVLKANNNYLSERIEWILV